MAHFTGETIPPILAAAKRLRQVRLMQREFLLRWANEKPRAKAASRLQSDFFPVDEFKCEALLPSQRDWSHLYRGSILDD